MKNGMSPKSIQMLKLALEKWGKDGGPEEEVYDRMYEVRIGKLRLSELLKDIRKLWKEEYTKKKPLALIGFFLVPEGKPALEATINIFRKTKTWPKKDRDSFVDSEFSRYYMMVVLTYILFFNLNKEYLVEYLDTFPEMMYLLKAIKL